MALQKFLASAASGATAFDRAKNACAQARAFYVANPNHADLYTSTAADQYFSAAHTFDGHSFPAFTAGLPIGTKQCIAVLDENFTVTSTWALGGYSHVRVEMPAARTYGHNVNDTVLNGNGAQYFSMVGTGSAGTRSLGTFQDRPEWTVNKPVWDMRTGGTNAKWLGMIGTSERYWNIATIYFLSKNACTDNNATSTAHQSTSLWTPTGSAATRPKNILAHDIDCDGQWAGYGWAQISSLEQSAQVNFRTAGGLPHRGEQDGAGTRTGLHNCVVINSYGEGVNAMMTLSPAKTTEASDNVYYDLIYVYGCSELMRSNRPIAGLPGGGIVPGSCKVDRAYVYGANIAPIQTSASCRNHQSRGIFSSSVPGMTAGDVVNVRYNGSFSQNVGGLGTQDATLSQAKLLQLWEQNHVDFGDQTPPPTAGAPVVTAAPADNLTPTSAAVHGSVNPNGATTSFIFEYGTTPGSYPSSTTPVTGLTGTAAINENATLTGLTASTTYYWRASATNTNGTSTSGERQFTTAPAAGNAESPTVTITSPATSVTDTNQQLVATATDPDGIDFIEYRARIPSTGTFTAWQQLAPTGGAQNEAATSIVLAADATSNIEVRAQDANAAPRTTTVTRDVTVTTTPPPPAPILLPSTTGRIAKRHHNHLYRNEAVYGRLPSVAEATAFGKHHDIISGQWHTGEAGHTAALLPEQGLLRLADGTRAEPALVAQNPDVLLNLYANAGLAEGETFGHGGGAPSSGTFVGYFPSSGTLDWYSSHVPTGFGNYAMFIDNTTRAWTPPALDPWGQPWPSFISGSSANWRKWQRKYTRYMLEQHPAGVNPATGRAYYRSIYQDISTIGPGRTAADLTAQMDEWITALRPLGYHLIVNSLQSGDAYFTDAKALLGHADAYNMEFFLKDPTSAGVTWPTPTRWEEDVSAVIDAQLAGAQITTATKIYDNTISEANSDKWRRIVCASALIGNRGSLWVEYNPFGNSSDPASSDPNTGVAWQNTWKWWRETGDYYPVYDAQPGAATDAAATAADAASGRTRANAYQVAGTPGLYKAGFDSGYAIVNLSGSSQNVTFTGTMKNAETGSAQSSPVTVPNNDAVILVATTVVAPPAAPTFTAKPPATTLATTATFTWGAAAGATSYQRNLDSAGYVTNGTSRTYTTPVLSAGAHNFKVRSVNSAGNSSAANWDWTILVDSGANDEAPSITLISSSSVEDANPTLNFQIDDPDGIFSVEYSLSGGPWLPANPEGGNIWSVSPHLPAEGSWTLDVRAQDNFSGGGGGGPAPGDLIIPANVPETARWIYYARARGDYAGCILGTGPSESHVTSVEAFVDGARGFYWSTCLGAGNAPFSPDGKATLGGPVVEAVLDQAKWDSEVLNPMAASYNGHRISVVPNILGIRGADATWPGHTAIQSWTPGDGSFVDSAINQWAFFMNQVDRLTIYRLWHEHGNSVQDDKANNWTKFKANWVKVVDRLRALGALGTDVSTAKGLVAWCPASHADNPHDDSDSLPPLTHVDVIGRDIYAHQVDATHSGQAFSLQANWKYAAQQWYDSYNPINGAKNPLKRPLMVFEHGVETTDPDRIAKQQQFFDRLNGTYPDNGLAKNDSGTPTHDGPWPGIVAVNFWDGGGNDLNDTPTGFKAMFKQRSTLPYFLTNGIATDPGP